jgi:lactate dehydrogenase-like 2-hydroxyacid dehydrogenase
MNLLLISIGSWLVNTARGAIVVKEDVAEALKSGHLRGYGGDVWCKFHFEVFPRSLNVMPRNSTKSTK